MKKIAIILSGSGYLDGSEIHEAVVSLIALDEANLKYQIFAPNKNQTKTVNHLTKEEVKETRNILVEAARIARGQISDLNELKVENFDALLMPGGFGAALNLCDYAIKGESFEVEKDLVNIIKAFHENNKPILALCISPVILAKIIPQVKITIGDSLEVASDIEKNSAIHQNAKINEIVIDEKNKVITTPCYMFDARPSEIYYAVKKAVSALNSFLG